MVQYLTQGRTSSMPASGMSLTVLCLRADRIGDLFGRCDRLLYLMRNAMPLPPDGRPQQSRDQPKGQGKSAVKQAANHAVDEGSINLALRSDLC